ncbi:MAG TPA: 6-phosphogluconolactonase [Polyangiaceae bacterium]|nr:6-phosphogluconolactonase [Polyangiaceae bacterium]
MATQVVPGKLVAVHDPQRGAAEGARLFADVLRRAVGARGTATMAVSGGSTPLATYAALAATDVPWDRVKLFWVDERAVAPDHERSNARAVREAFGATPFLGVFPMDGTREPSASAAAYAELLAQEVPGAPPALDLVVLGIGDDGHTASLFPGDPAVTDVESAVLGVPATDAREARITLGRAVLAEARNVYVVAYGAAKNAALERAWALHGDVLDCPARITRGFKGRLSWLVDRSAGGIG